jgi:hypothetical protein
MGFYGVFVGIKYSNTQALLQKFDDDTFSDLNPVTIKVAISVPYQANTTFERVDGEVEYRGEFYRLVKQRYANDTLFIVCVKDTHSKNIKQALSDYVKTFTDTPAQSSQSKTIPGFIKDYLITETQIGQVSAGWSSGLTTSSVVVSFSSVSLAIASPPPKS